MQNHARPCIIMQYHEVLCRTMQYHAIPCNTMQYLATPHKTMQNNAITCNTMQYHAISCNTMQYHASLISADGAYLRPVGSIRHFYNTFGKSQGGVQLIKKENLDGFCHQASNLPPPHIGTNFQTFVYTYFWSFATTNTTNVRRTLHFQDINFKSSFNWFRIDIHQQLRPLTANYLVIYKVISSTISLVHNIQPKLCAKHTFSVSK